MFRKLATLLGLAAAGGTVAGTPQDFIATSVEGLRLQTEAHSGTWHLGKEANWSVDQDQGEIVFSFDDGREARAPVQIVGTLNTRDSTFLWGWDHPSVQAPLRQHAAKAREWGEANGQERFTTRVVPATEAEAWEFTALAVRLAGANGAYRGRSGPAWVYMTFGEIRLSKPQS